jgi:hypothetical protein
MSHASALPALFLSVAQLWYLWLIVAIAAWTILLALRSAAENRQSRIGQWLVVTAFFRPRLSRCVHVGLRHIAFTAVALLIFAFIVIGASLVGRGLGEMFSEFNHY